MNKNEILEKAKKDNQKVDEREYQLQLRAAWLSRIFGIIISFVLLAIGTIVDIPSMGWTAATIVCVMDFVQDLFLFITTKKHKWFTLIIDVSCLILFTILLVFSII